MDARLPAALEARALMRAAEGAGGMAMLLHKGDPERGSLLLVVLERGKFHSLLSREMQRSGAYDWARNDLGEGDKEQRYQEFVAKRRGFDPDLWVIELDVPDADRYCAQAIFLS